MSPSRLAVLFFLMAAAGSATASPPCEVQVRLDPPRAVVGQQVLYRVRIFSTEDVRAVEWSHPPAFPRMRTETLPGDPQPSLDPALPGRRARDERRALFAEETGAQRLEAPSLRCVLRDGRTIETPVPAAVLEVEPPPEEGRPSDYVGVVGPLTLHVTVTPSQLELGESLRVAVMVRGEGNLWDLPEPFGEAAFGGSERFVRRPEEVLERGRALLVRRHFAYDVVPREAGTLRVPALALPYLDPRSGRYAVARSEGVDVAVAAPHDDVSPRPAAAATPAPVDPARDDPARSVGPGPVWLAVVLALATGGLVLQRWRSRAPSAAATLPPPSPEDSPTDRAAQLEAALRAALARHVPDASSVTPQELLSRADTSPSVQAAAHLLLSLERARFDPTAPPADEEAVRRAIADL